MKLDGKAAAPYPSPAERVGRVAVAKRRSGGAANIEEFLKTTPGLATLADPPRKGEG
jgi:hypothetical protein